MILTPEREKQLAETAHWFSQKLAGMLWQGSLPRFFYVADVRGRVVETRPVQEFFGLEKLIRTGQRESEYAR